MKTKNAIIEAVLKETRIKCSASQTNLESENSYYEVTSPFSIFHIIGSKPSNASYGNARIYQPIYKKVKANIGDQIHNLFDGLFHIAKGSNIGISFDTGEYKDKKIWMGKNKYRIVGEELQQREFAPFENKKNYYQFDLTKLKKIEKPENRITYQN